MDHQDELADRWGRLREAAGHLFPFLRLLAGRFLAHEGPRTAGALSYTTLLSLVPLMTVVLAVFSAFPLADRVAQDLQDFLFRNFVPASSEVIQRYLAEFSAKAGRLTGAGSAFLVVVALLLMANIDRTLNAIWEVKRRRSPLQKFLVYWALLSLGPLLIGVSLLATSFLISLPLLSDAAASGVGRRLLGLTPLLASTLAFTLLYALVPNRRVRLGHAAAGGVLAALLFEGAKRGFGLYVTTFPTYEAIYGALATIPLFLVWLYLSWMVVLLGAEFTHCLEIYRQYAGGVPRQRPGLVDALRLLIHLGEVQARGGSLSVRALAAREPGWSELWVEALLDQLQRSRLVHRTEAGDWVLARPLDRVSLYELYRSGPFELPAPGGPGWPVGDERLEQLLRAADQGLRSALAVSLDALVPGP